MNDTNTVFQYITYEWIECDLIPLIMEFLIYENFSISISRLVSFMIW